MANNTKNNNKKNQFQGGPKNLIIGVAFYGCLYLGFGTINRLYPSNSVIPYSAFLTKVEQNQV